MSHFENLDWENGLISCSFQAKPTSAYVEVMQRLTQGFCGAQYFLVLELD